MNFKILPSIKKYNSLAVLALSTLIITLFIYFTPPGPFAGIIPGLSYFQNIHGDLPVYISRFILSFLLFAIIPLGYMKLSGNNLSFLGLNRVKHNFFKDRIYLVLLLVSITIGISSSFDQALSGYYPYSKTLTDLASQKNGLYFIVHLLSYIVFYYIPWEIFFRGFLVFPFLPQKEMKSEGIDPGLLMIAAFQVIPSSIIHFGHPITETIGAIPFGIICAWLVIKYKSILPGLILHAVTGVTMDFFITFT